MTLDDAISEQWHSLAIEEQSAVLCWQYAEEVESVGLIASLAGLRVRCFATEVLEIQWKSTQEIKQPNSDLDSRQDYPSKLNAKLTSHLKESQTS